jgi:predicted metal-dependent hydrolase
VKDREKDLKDVVAQEGRRGRRPVDIEQRRKALKRLEEMRRLLTLGAEKEFRAAMRAFGLREDSKQFLDAPHARREFRP